MPPSGCGTLCRLESSLMAKSTPDQSDLFNPKTSSDSISATSSRASGDGALRLASLDGRMLESYGQALARVSRLALRGSEAAKPTSGIYGPTFFASSVPEGPLSSWENRLRERLAMVGSTECALIWREKRSPAGRSTSRLSRSTPLTSAIASIGSPETTVDSGPWTTPSATAAHHQGQEYSQGGTPLTMQMSGASTWATPQHRDKGGGSYADPEKALARMASGHQVNLQDQMVAFEKATWKSPMSSDVEKQSENPETTIRRMAAGRQTSLNSLMALTATSGEKPDGSSATTAKRGAPNPAHPLWLMGFGDVFLFLAPKNAPIRHSRAKKPDGSRA